MRPPQQPCEMTYRISRQQLEFVLLFSAYRAPLSFASANPVNRQAAEKQIVWPSPERSESHALTPSLAFGAAGECGVLSSSSSSDEDQNEQRARVAADDWPLHRHALTSSSPHRHVIHASSTHWVAPLSEEQALWSFNVKLQPLCGTQIGHHSIAILPTTTAGSTPSASVTADQAASRRPRVHTLEEEFIGESAVETHTLEDAWQLLENSSFSRQAEVPTLMTPGLARVVYWDRGASDPSLQWSLWWLYRGAMPCDLASVGPPCSPHSPHTASSSPSCVPSYHASPRPLPVVLHARSVTLRGLQEALALPLPGSPVAGSDASVDVPVVPSSCFADKLTGLFVSLGASEEWVHLVDMMSSSGWPDKDAIATQERAGGLTNALVTLFTEITAHASRVASAAVASVPSTRRTLLERVVLIVSQEQKHFVNEWRTHKSLQDEPHGGGLHFQLRHYQSFTGQVVVKKDEREGDWHAGTTRVGGAGVSERPREADRDICTAHNMATQQQRSLPVACSGTRLACSPFASHFRFMTEIDNRGGFLRDVSILGELPNLQVLKMGGCSMLDSQSVCEMARSSRSLRFLDLSGCQHVHNRVAVAVAAIPTLEVLSLSGTDVTTECVSMLIAHASHRLVRLAVDQCRRLRVTPTLALGIPSLTHLSARGTLHAPTASVMLDDEEDEAAAVRVLLASSAGRRAADGGAPQLAHLTGTRGMSARDVRWWFFSCPNLVCLDVGDSFATTTSFLTPLPPLEESVFPPTSSADDFHKTGPAALSASLFAFPRFLDTLSVQGCRHVTDLRVLRHFPFLRVLIARRTGLTSAGLVGLEDCVLLEKVALDACRALDTISPLEQLPSLRDLTLSNCTSLTENGLAPIAFSTSVRWLNLSQCHMLRSIAFLGRMRALSWLALNDTSVDAQNLRAFAHALRATRRGTSQPPFVELSLDLCASVALWPAECARDLEDLAILTLKESNVCEVSATGLGQHVRACDLSHIVDASLLLSCVLATPSLRELDAVGLPLRADALSLSKTAASLRWPERDDATRTIPDQLHALRRLNVMDCDGLQSVDALASFAHLAVLNLMATAVTDAALLTYTSATHAGEGDDGTAVGHGGAGANANTAHTFVCAPCQRHHARRCQVRCHAATPCTCPSHGHNEAHHRPLRALSLRLCRGIFSTQALTAPLCPHLHTLVLSESNVQDWGLVPLAWCPGLVQLALNGCKGITCLSPLAHLPRLEALYADGTNVTSTAGLEGLVCGFTPHNPPPTQRMTSIVPPPLQEACPTAPVLALNALSYPRVSVDADSGRLGSRSHVSALRYLSLRGCSMIEEGFAVLARLSALEVLNMSNCAHLTAAHFVQLKAARAASPQHAFFPKLTELTVSFCDALDGALDGLETMEHLVLLRCDGVSLQTANMPTARRVLLF